MILDVTHYKKDQAAAVDESVIVNLFIWIISDDTGKDQSGECWGWLYQRHYILEQEVSFITKDYPHW